MAVKEKKPPKPKKLNLNKMALLAEPLKAAGPEREACRMCGLWNVACQSPSVPEEWTGNMVVVTRGPTPKAERSLLRASWRKAGFNDEDVALVPAVRCSAENPSMQQIRACRPFLLQALKKLSPKNVLAAGSTALRALRNKGETSIIKNRGRTIHVPAGVSITPDLRSTSGVEGGLHIRAADSARLQAIQTAALEAALKAAAAG